MKPIIRFDEDAHTYTVDGIVRRSVTQILKAAGEIDDTYFTEHARTRGVLVHKAVDLYNKNRLDMSSIDIEIEQYVTAYISFLRISNARVIASESMVYSKTYKYPGTFDLYARIGECRYMIDVKTNHFPSWATMQVAAYFAAALESGYRPQSYGVLVLKKNGDWRFTFNRNHELDFNRFLACKEKVDDAN